MLLRFLIFLKLKLQNKTIYSTVNCMVHYTLILEGKYRLSIGRLSFPHTCDRAQQKLKSDILVYSNIFKLKLIWTTCTSAPGLQEKIGILGKFCDDWCLTVNIQKTKIMVFNNAGRLSNVQFKLNNTVLECVHRYKYLGLTFCSSGSFMYAQEELYNTASKAYFKLKRPPFIKSWASYKYAFI